MLPGGCVVLTGWLGAGAGDVAGTLGLAGPAGALPSTPDWLVPQAASKPVSTTQPPGSTQTPTSAPAATPAQSAARQVRLQSWFTRQGKLFVTERTVPATTSIGRAALDRLLAGPSAAEYTAGLRSQIPAGTNLLGLSITKGIATVDLSSSFGAAAGPSTMALRIAQVVYSLAQFPTITGVRFDINGHGVTAIGGVPVQAPQTPAMYDGYLPAITVQNPAIGEQVTSPVTVSGTADVFEAVVSVQILDSAGNEIARTFGTASCGTGCRGDYSLPVSYTVSQAQPGTIEVFESSPKNGQPVDVQLIPVMLTP